MSRRGGAAGAGSTPIAVLAAAGALLWMMAGPARAQEQVRIEVGAVLATDTEDHFDTQLASMRVRLQQMFGYRSYRLVHQEDRGIELGAPVSFSLPGDHDLDVRARDCRSDRVALHLALRKGSEVVLSTDFSLGQDGRVILGGPSFRDGVLLIWVAAHSAAASRAAEASPPNGVERARPTAVEEVR